MPEVLRWSARSRPGARRSVAVVPGALACSCILVAAGASEMWALPPRVLDPTLELVLFASDPDIVTPVGAAFDARGRLLVIEEHTHFPPEGYEGPRSDRVRLVEDRDGDGRADRFTTFLEGTRHTMALVRGEDGWLYVATRARLLRVRDTDGDDRADAEEEIARLETKGDYPHNGLGGLARDGEGRLLLGLGENLGEPYRLVGRDGVTLKGGGEGGNIYRLGPDGSGLERIATGFWNPFGITVDRYGRVFAVDNDPDGSPPCRLLHIVPGGDYGYQFRYGRSGRHPLQAWDGQLPGTLPMVAGTGEAPCAVMPARGKLWVTSWGDYRIERFTLTPRGASFGAKLDIAVQGDEEFRPVGLAQGPDGSLWATDWVDRSYPVHGRGRIWHLRFRDEAGREAELPLPTDLEREAERLRHVADPIGLKSPDPFTHQAAVRGLQGDGAASGFGRTDSDRSGWRQLDDGRARLGALEALRWRAEAAGEGPPAGNLEAAFEDPAADVRLYAVRWAADSRLSEHLGRLDALLRSPATSPQLLAAAIAARQWIERGTVDGSSESSLLLEVLDDSARPAALRVAALRLLPPDAPQLTKERWQTLLTVREPTLLEEAVRTAALRRDGALEPLLLAIAGDASRDPALRADAVLGVASLAALERLAASSSPAPVARVVARALAVRAAGSAPVATAPVPAGVETPSTEDTDAWLRLAGEGGDPRAGWRVFFAPEGAGCARCHRREGRGAAIGPDLTGIERQRARRGILEAILQPSRDIAPQYQPWVVTTKDGQVRSGYSLGRVDTVAERFVSGEGEAFLVPDAEVLEKSPASTSIMPEGLTRTISPEDLRDLLAYLCEPRL